MHCFGTPAALSVRRPGPDTAEPHPMESPTAVTCTHDHALAHLESLETTAARAAGGHLPGAGRRRAHGNAALGAGRDRRRSGRGSLRRRPRFLEGHRSLPGHADQRGGPGAGPAPCPGPGSRSEWWCPSSQPGHCRHPEPASAGPAHPHRRCRTDRDTPAATLRLSGTGGRQRSRHRTGAPQRHVCRGTNDRHPAGGRNDRDPGRLAPAQTAERVNRP